MANDKLASFGLGVFGFSVFWDLFWLGFSHLWRDFDGFKILRQSLVVFCLLDFVVFISSF